MYTHYAMHYPGQESGVIIEISENVKQNKQGAITQQLFDSICKKTHPWCWLELESCRIFNKAMDEPNNWSEADINQIREYIERGYGPFLDMLFAGRKGMTKYLILRAYLVRKNEIKKAERDYKWKYYRMPEIINNTIVIGILSLCGIGAIALLSYVSTEIKKMLLKRK